MPPHPASPCLSPLPWVEPPLGDRSPSGGDAGLLTGWWSAKRFAGPTSKHRATHPAWNDLSNRPSHVGSSPSCQRRKPAAPLGTASEAIAPPLSQFRREPRRPACASSPQNDVV